ncbi:cartilage matrix protein-like [Argopecten irradians]|uniref:cartilage matrix protein-like n=1 Tax=Argopecten irradians TaxID=31199 RepID=UPI00371A031C
MEKNGNIFCDKAISDFTISIFFAESLPSKNAPQIRENKIPVKITGCTVIPHARIVYLQIIACILACKSLRQDIVFILDTSTSVGVRNFRKMLNFTKEFLQTADIDSGSVRVGLITYSSSVTIQFHLNTFSSKKDVFSAIDEVVYQSGSTNTAGALKALTVDMFTRDHGSREDVSNVTVIITDGVSNTNMRQTIPYAEEAKLAGISIYAIGIGIKETAELKEIASTPTANFFYTIDDFAELDQVRESLFESFCLGNVNVILIVEVTWRRFLSTTAFVLLF